MYIRITEKQFNKTTEEVKKNMKDSITSSQHTLEECVHTITIEPYRNIIEAFPNNDFQRILLGAVDETFSLLGRQARQSIYFQLEKTFRMTKQDIPLEIEKFTRALEEITGPGAKLLEIEIMKHLYEKIGPEFRYSSKKRDLTFTEYLTATRAFLSLGTSLEKSMPNGYYDYKFC